MNILFFDLYYMNSYEEQGISSDLARALIRQGHKIFTITPNFDVRNTIKNSLNNKILFIKSPQVSKNKNFIKKAINLILLNINYKSAIKKNLKNNKFDLILYSTPPITLCGVVLYAKKKFGAKSYLMLKDIFPQNAVDLEILSKKGFKGLIYRYYRKKEKQFYKISDKIGCMSKANLDYILKHNSIEKTKVEIFPNSAEINFNFSYRKNEICKDNLNFINGTLNLKSKELKEKSKTMCSYVSLGQKPIENLESENTIKSDIEKTRFIYGGNLGKPQCVPFIIECLKDNINKEDREFVICGDGSDFDLLQAFVDKEKPQNIKLYKRLSKNDFDEMVKTADVGLVFLDYRFTIPNYPSRILTYMKFEKPILAVTDESTDLKDDIEKGNFGWWCPSNNVEKFTMLLDKICNSNEKIILGKNSRKYLIENFNVEKTSKLIEKHFQSMK